jgi:hypothetical protein
MKKTFKIGECCEGGIIEVEIDNSTIQIRNLDWDSKEELKLRLFNRESFKESLINVFMFLTEITTAYWADEIIKYIKNKI